MATETSIRMEVGGGHDWMCIVSLPTHIRDGHKTDTRFCLGWGGVGWGLGC